MLKLSIKEFIKFLKSNNIMRFSFIFKDGNIIASHKQLQDISDFLISDKRDFNEHEGLFFQLTEKYDVLQGAFVHRTCRGQAAGGVRFWNYQTVEDYFRDGLRLAKGMTHKNALAGLWWGGGKGVMANLSNIDKTDSQMRAYVYQEYGKFMTSLNGCYITAEDVGTSVDDMENIFKNTRFTTCIPASLGGSGNPSVPTARGVIAGMEAALKFKKMGSLKDKVIAVQGMGHVGEPLINFLFDKGVKKVIAADVSSENVQALEIKYPANLLEARLVDLTDTSIFTEECDILSPCATGAILNPNTIPLIKAKIICGAANNQLEDAARDDEALKTLGISYIPDFLTNRMGIVNCANEQYGSVNSDPVIEQHLNKDWEFSVYNTVTKVLEEAEKTNSSTGAIALKLAEGLSLIKHPIFGHRGKLIINSLLDNKWYLHD